MAVKCVVPSTLVRALQRFAVRDKDNCGTAAHVTRGLLLGASNDASSDENVVTVFGVLRDGEERGAVLPHLPGGISPVGTFIVWMTGKSSLSEDDEATQAAALAKTHVDTAVSPVALVYVHESKRLHFFDGSSSAAQPLEVVDCLHASDFISATEYLLLRSSVSFQAESREQLTKLRRELENDYSTSLFFQFPEDPKAIFNARGVDIAAKEADQRQQLDSLVKIPEKRAAETATTSNKSKKNKAKAAFDAWETTKQPLVGDANKRGDFLSSELNKDATTYLKTLEYGDIAHVELLQSLAFTTLPTATVTAPTVEIPSSKSTKTTTSSLASRVHVDALIVVAQSASVAEVVATLRAELIKQITRLETLWTTTPAKLQSHHFGLVGAAFPLTMPSSNSKLALSKAATTAIAELLLQPASRTLFDPSRCSLVAKAAALADIDVLFNVHEGIPSSGVPNGTQYLVDGFYGYYHYMQQAMNDKGWGCAYRSLQTLASWLFWNQYTQSPTLSHREIQQTLVKIGDKPAAFVGSREWIGSMEVGFVLDEVFGVSFRTLNVSSGPELVDQAQELKHHFETQGTPVMMGGGQLAFTLLGIDYNASSGECAFLILDPHYVGAEDLTTIQTKTIPLEGYKAVPCGWRKASTFAKNSFYNLCLPQRPLE